MPEKERCDLDPQELEREDATALPDREEMSILMLPGGIVPPALAGSDGDAVPQPEPLPPTPTPTGS
jgi:hypothetical protein